jgi:hypothetical protein
MARRPVFAVALLLPLLLAGCELFGSGQPSAEKVAAQREADGRAVGGACRHAGRAIEDCFTLNKRADRAAVFAGWREMNDYMRENKLEPVPPALAAQTAAAADAPSKSGAVDAKADAKSTDARAAEARPAKPHS